MSAETANGRATAKASACMYTLEEQECEHVKKVDKCFYSNQAVKQLPLGGGFCRLSAHETVNEEEKHTLDP
eukprot:1145695-Pelagomonas_calceolata.AAC.3